MLIKLFIVFFQIGLFSIGGGYASLAYINSIVVSEHQWLSVSDFTDLITLSQMTPGPLAINAATFVGTKMAGVLGAVVATVAFVLPAFIIVLTLSMIYYKYKSLSGMQLVMTSMRPVVIGLISAVCISLVTGLLKTDYILKSGLLIFAVLVMRKIKVNPLIIIVGSGLLYFVLKTIFNH